jgi:hypothetical protein
MNESEKQFKKEIDYHRYWKDRAERAEVEIENVKKEADRLMINKIAEYEEKLDALRKKIDPAILAQKARESGL